MRRWGRTVLVYFGAMLPLMVGRAVFMLAEGEGRVHWGRLPAGLTVAFVMCMLLACFGSAPRQIDWLTPLQKLLSGSRAGRDDRPRRG